MTTVSYFTQFTNKEGQGVENMICQLLQRVFSPDYNGKSPASLFTKQEWKALPLQRIKKGEAFIQFGFAAEMVYFLLQGQVRVSVVTSEGAQAVIDSIEAPHLFGVTEAVQGKQQYSARVEGASSCLVAAVPAQEFLRQVYGDAKASQTLILFLATIANEIMDKAERKAIRKPREILLYYLYQYGKKHTRPCRLSLTRKALSEELHINLRTLYRYLAVCEQEGVLLLEGGKVVITEEGFKRLEVFANENK